VLDAVGRFAVARLPATLAAERFWLAAGWLGPGVRDMMGEGGLAEFMLVD